MSSVNLFKTVPIPEEVFQAQLISVEKNGISSTFIFGSNDNGNIYKYNNKTKSYNIYDKYKYNNNK